MIISHRHKFIFIKTAKTAGTSLELALAPFCGDSDIVTHTGPGDEALRLELGLRGPQNVVAPYSSYRLRHWYRLARRREKAQFHSHMSALRARSLLNRHIWSSYFKFCFERNPWDKVISWYYWRQSRGKSPVSLAEFIRSGEAGALGRKKGIDLYTIDSEIAVDRVCLYENMTEELAYLREALGFDKPIVLPQAKSGVRHDRRHYREMLGETEREVVARTFVREIALFGYQF